MKLIVLYGPPAVGKLTVAKELSKQTGFPILDNHKTIDLVTSFFPFDSRPFYSLIRDIRLLIIKEFAKQGKSGLILTAGFPNNPEVKEFYRRVDDFVLGDGGETCYVRLSCTPEELRRRVGERGRKEYGKINTVEALEKALKDLDFSAHQHNDCTIVVENTKTPPEEVAVQIAQAFKL